MEPQGGSALVTGGAGGLGGATVRRLVEAGCESIRLDGALRLPPK